MGPYRPHSANPFKRARIPGGDGSRADEGIFGFCFFPLLGQPKWGRCKWGRKISPTFSGVFLFFPNSVSLEGSNGGKEGRIRPQRGGRPMPYRTAPDNPARPVFAECFKDLGLPEISAARFCRVFQGFAAPALPRRSPEARF